MNRIPNIPDAALRFLADVCALSPAALSWVSIGFALCGVALWFSDTLLVRWRIQRELRAFAIALRQMGPDAAEQVLRNLGFTTRDSAEGEKLLTKLYPSNRVNFGVTVCIAKKTEQPTTSQKQNNESSDNRRCS